MKFLFFFYFFTWIVLTPNSLLKIIKMKILFSLFVFCLLCPAAHADKKVTLTSPDGTIGVNITVGENISYNVTADGNTLLTDCVLALNKDGRQLGSRPKLNVVKRLSVDEKISREVPVKNAEVVNHYNAAILNMAGGYSVEFRAFDNGVAYRFATTGKGMANINNETFTIGFPADYKAHMSFTGGFKTSYEEPYSHINTNAYKPSDAMSYLPVLLETDKNYKILISESDLKDYPCMFLKSTGKNGMTSVFPKTPLEFGPDGDRSQKILKEADYIARTSAQRTFPWRYFVISKEDKNLLENEMTFALASPCELKDPSWVKPGQVSWDWWNHKMIWGVDFKAGINNDTYKYYIDFASLYGIPYIILDEGWAKDTRDPYATIPEINIPELVKYGKTKNVGLILWLPWLTVENHMELFKTYEEWGVPGVKIDFMDRSDQCMVNYFERVAKEAAKHHILVDFHGSFKPAGLERRYPNVLSYEGVRGMEQNGGCQTENTIFLPFIRNAVGPMDFTPGSMYSAQPYHYSCTDPNPMGMGTRAHQMAMYVVFESGIQMLADSPTRYLAEQECTDFITSVPVTWDETRIIDAKLGEYVVVARRKAGKWFIGAMNNGTKRELKLPLDFLGDAADRHLTCFADGVNADRQAFDYVKRTQDVSKSSVITLSLERNGGWCGVIE